MSAGCGSSGSGTNNCAENSTCEIEVTAPDFDDVFVALPEDGYKFVQWSHDSVCTDKQNPVCPASNVGFAGIPEVIAIINSEAEYFLRPIFTSINSTQTKTRVVRDANGVLIGEIVDYLGTDRVRVLADYTASDGAQYTFLLSVGKESMEPVFRYNPSGISQTIVLYYGDASCATDNLWIPTSFVNPTVYDVVSPLVSEDALLAQGRNALFEPIWSVVSLTETVSGFAPYSNNGGGCGTLGGVLPMRQVELVEEGWLGSFAAPYTFIEE